MAVTALSGLLELGMPIILHGLRTGEQIKNSDYDDTVETDRCP